MPLQDSAPACHSLLMLSGHGHPLWPESNSLLSTTRRHYSSHRTIRVQSMLTRGFKKQHPKHPSSGTRSCHATGQGGSFPTKCRMVIGDHESCFVGLMGSSRSSCTRGFRDGSVFGVMEPDSLLCIEFAPID